MKNMKKLLSLLLALVFVVGCLAGCGGTTSGGSSGEPAGDVKELAVMVPSADHGWSGAVLTYAQEQAE